MSHSSASTVHGRLPLVTLAMAVTSVAVFVADVPVEAVQWTRSDAWSFTALTYAFAHTDGLHLLANLSILGLVGFGLERHVGSPRVAVVAVAGLLSGAAGHALVSGFPLAGMSAGVYALVAYHLVYGWHCPFVSQRTGRPVLWPSHLFYLLLAGEAWLMVATLVHPLPWGAGAHLAGLAVGIAACGVFDRRWPGAFGSRRAVGAGAPRPVEPRRSSLVWTCR